MSFSNKWFHCSISTLNNGNLCYHETIKPANILLGSNDLEARDGTCNAISKIRLIGTRSRSKTSLPFRKQRAKPTRRYNGETLLVNVDDSASDKINATARTERAG